MTNLHINETVAQTYIKVAQEQRDQFKRDLSEALNSYTASWYHQDRITYQKKHPKWTHPRIEDVKALEKIINENTATTDLVNDIIDYIDGDNDHFWFAWFSPLRDYMRDAVDNFTAKHNTEIIDRDLQLVSDKPFKKLSGDSLSEDLSDDQSTAENPSESPSQIDRLSRQLESINLQLQEKEKAIQQSNSELSQLRAAIQSKNLPEIKQLIAERDEAKQELSSKSQELGASRQQLADKTKELQVAMAKPVQHAPVKASPPVKGTSPKRALPDFAPPKGPLVAGSPQALPVTNQADEIVSLNKELSELKARHEEIKLQLEASKQEKQRFSEQLLAVTAQLQNHEKDKASLLLQIEELKQQPLAANTQTEILQAQSFALENLTKQLEETLAKLRSAEADSQSLIATKQQQKETIQEQEELIQTLTSSNRQLDEAVSEAATLKARELETHIQDLQKSRAELAQTKELLSTALSVQKELDEKLKQSQAENKALKQQQEALRKENFAQGERINAQSKQIKLLQNIIEELKTKFNQFQSIAFYGVTSLGSMFQTASEYFRNALFEKKNSSPESSKAKVDSSKPAHTNDADKRKSTGLVSDSQKSSTATSKRNLLTGSIGKKAGNLAAAMSQSTESVVKEDDSSEDSKDSAKTEKKKGFFSSFRNRAGKSATEKSEKSENIDVNLSGLAGKTLRDTARNQIGAKKGEAYRLTVELKAPDSSKTATELVTEFLDSQNTLQKAFSDADELLSGALAEVVYDDVAERTLATALALETRNTQLQEGIVTQRQLFDREKDSNLRRESKIRELESELTRIKSENAALNKQLSVPQEDIDLNNAPPPPPAFDVVYEAQSDAKIHALETELAAEKERTTRLQKQIEKKTSDAEVPTTNLPLNAVPLAKIESLEAECAQLRLQLESLQAAALSGTHAGADPTISSTAPPAAPPPPAPAAPPAAPAFNPTTTTPFRESSQTGNSNKFFSSAATTSAQQDNAPKPLSIAEELEQRKKAGSTLKRVETTEKKPAPQSSQDPIAAALLAKFASMNKIKKEEEEAENNNDSDSDSGFDP